MLDKCVICGADIESRCRCLRCDTTCSNGHKYHYSDSGEIHEGISDHGSTECCTEKKVIIVKE